MKVQSTACVQMHLLWFVDISDWKWMYWPNKDDVYDSENDHFSQSVLTKVIMVAFAYLHWWKYMLMWSKLRFQQPELLESSQNAFKMVLKCEPLTTSVEN